MLTPKDSFIQGTNFVENNLENQGDIKLPLAMLDIIYNSN